MPRDALLHLLVEPRLPLHLSFVLCHGVESTKVKGDGEGRFGVEAKPPCDDGEVSEKYAIAWATSSPLPNHSTDTYREGPTTFTKLQKLSNGLPIRCGIFFLLQKVREKNIPRF